MINFQIDAQVLNAFNANGASTEETRYYLRGVHIEISGGVGFAVATNGHVMFVHRFEADCADIKFIIPSALIKSMKIDKKAKAVSISVPDESANRLEVKLSAGAGVFSDFTIDGTFPDWRRAAVKEITFKDEYVVYGVATLTAMEKVAKALNAPKAYIVPNSPGPGLMVFPSRPDITGFIMPMRAAVTLKEGAQFSPPFEF